ncbi:54S ribosomal protein L19, mitochondrial [[Candida] jaroonii]|uniref:54S ribosomal protein L19, mitochondrial n=1 Tax=[Candida] jaroonii TaxID=467808 RepID=A0ACA9YEH5_9ASCO|nr:54S ribosomal protein L19, mitochondrial [[Candida] jaroonii]
MSKAIAKNVMVKLIVGAGQAAPAPPVGPALGSKGVKAIDFCKEFNARTANYQPGTPIPVLLTVKPDRTFSFEMKSPPTSWLLLKAADAKQGSGKPSSDKVGEISLKHVYEIAKIKKTDDRHKNIDMKSIVGSIISTASVVGINVVP